MTRPGFATQLELLQWAASIPARGGMPRLVRRLVLETGRGVESLDFPADEGTATGGVDGVAVCADDAPFVPQGQTVWELSVGQSTSAKATRDYSGRLVTPDGRPTSETTYIAVSLRRWGDRRTWAAARQADNRWKAVRAYGIDDVETWLESAPVTHAWISEQLGLKPYGMQTAEAWWTAWSTATRPALPGGVVLAGRDDVAAQLRAAVGGGPQIVSVRGDSVDDVLAFVAAVALEDDAKGEGEILARLAFVDDVSAWRALAVHPEPLVLVARTAAIMEEARSAPGHHVIVPRAGRSDADIELPPIDATSAKAALVAAGLDNDRRADEAARLGRRSLTALRRDLAEKPELHAPSWAEEPVDRIVRAVLLANSWDDSSPGDQEVLSGLCGLPYDDLRERLPVFADTDDPLVLRVGDTWTVVSPYSAWLQLRRKLRADDVDRLRTIVAQVLLEEDPAFAMNAGERWTAPMQGLVRRFSSDLRAGLASTVALLGVHGAEVTAGRGSTGAATAQAIVRGLLARANEDQTAAAWSGLSAHLPLLAEGAPDAFLDGVRAGTVGEGPVLRRVFELEADPMLARSPHTGLLWSLEVLAWSPDHFGQAISLLARLVELDPGGRLSNRPDRSLAEIYCPWHPETSASTEQRLNGLDGVRDRHPSVAWPLMLSLLPELRGVHFHTSSPTFRDWKPSKSEMTYPQLFEFLEALFGRLLQDASDSPERWLKLVEKADHLSPDSRGRLREALKAHVDDGSLEADGREVLWDGLRKLIARHREHAQADWALPGEELDELEAVEQALAPSGALKQHAWLFEDWMPDLGNAKYKDDEYDHEGYTAALTARRDEAVRAVEDEAGWDGLVELAMRAASAFWVGNSLARAGHNSYEDECLPLLQAFGAERELARSYFGVRFATGRWDWLESLFARAELAAEQIARLLLLTDDHPRSWQRADEFGNAVAEAYWREFDAFGLGTGSPLVVDAARRILDAGRPGAALRLLSLHLDDEGAGAEHAAVSADALDAVLGVDDPYPELSDVREYGLQRVFDFLEKHRDTVTVGRVAHLEWAYLGALGLDPKAPSLHQALAEDPAFFVGIVSQIYRGEGAEAAEITAERQGFAENAYRLLGSWSTLPGQRADGTLDFEALRAWVLEATKLLEEAARRAVGEVQIGHVLAHAPADDDGTWPARPIRDLLEVLQSEKVEQGITTQVYNDRGVTSRLPEDGGDQERELADQYRTWAEKVRDRWPRSATVLRSLAETYDQDARRMDDDAERRRKGID